MGSGLGWVAALLGWRRHPVKMKTNRDIKNMKEKQEAIEAVVLEQLAEVISRQAQEKAARNGA